MDNQQALRRDHLLRNPAVTRFLSLLDAANYSFEVDGVHNQIIAVFAVGSSGRDGSRDIDIDVVFKSEAGFNVDGPLPILSSQLESLAIQSNRHAEQVFYSASENVWPSKHIPFVVWPVYAKQFQDPGLFRTQLPADFLRCDGGGRIANLIHLNEMIQTGVTLWSAAPNPFRIEDYQIQNPIRSIPTHEAVEYFAISTRDLAKAYLLDVPAAKDYLLAKAILRAVYAFCVACANSRIDRYDLIPPAFLSQLEVESQVAASVSRKLGDNHPIAQAIHAGLAQLESSQALILEAARVWRTRGCFDQDVSIQIYLLSTEIRRFVELTFATSERPQQSIDFLVQYQQRTIPELAGVLLSSKKALNDPLAYQFAQELSLIDSVPGGIHEVGRVVTSSDYWKGLELNAQEERLALRHFDLWWKSEEAGKLGLETSVLVSRVELVFDTSRRLKVWYENSIDALLAAGNYSEALRFQCALDRAWKDGELFKSRQKYIYEQCLNIHWVVDAILAHAEPAARNARLDKVLEVFGKLPVRTRLGRDEEGPHSVEARPEDIWKACQDCLQAYGLWGDGFVTYLSGASIPSLYELAAMDESTQLQLELNRGSHPLMEHFHLAHQVCLENFGKALELKENGQPGEGLKHLERALLCEPNWGAGHALASAWYLEAGDEEKAIRSLSKAAAIGTRFAVRDEVRKMLSGSELRSALLSSSKEHPVEKQAAIEEKLLSNVRKLAWLHTFLTQDGIVDYSFELGNMPDQHMPTEPGLRQVFLTPIEWGEIGDLLSGGVPLQSEFKQLTELTSTLSEQWGGLDPRVTEFQDLANWSAIVVSKGLSKAGGSTDEISPEAFGLVLPEKDRAQTALQKGKFKEVVRILAPMEKFHLLLPRDYLCLGQALLALSRLEDARKSFEKGYCLKAEDIRFLRNLAQIDRLRGKLDEALARCQEALLHRPDYCNLHLTIAELYEEMHDRRQQIEYLRSAALCTDLDPERHWLIVDQLRREGQPLEACVVCLRMLVKGGNNAKLKAALKSLVKELGRTEDSQVTGFLAPLVQAAWDDPDELLRLGSLYDEAQVYEDALVCYRRCVSLDPQLAAAYFNMGNTFQHMGDHDGEMLESYRKAFELNPRVPDIVGGLALAYKKAGDFRRAIELFTEALNLNPNMDGGWTTLGNCYREIGDLRRALECHKRAAELNPNEPLNMQNLAGTYLEIQNWHEAIRISIESLRKWGQAKIFRTISTIALMDGEVSLKEYPEIIPDWFTAVKIASQRGWISNLENYSPTIVNVCAILGAANAERVQDSMKQLAQLLPIFGFNVAFCERRLMSPSFDPRFLELDLWSVRELLSKVLRLREQQSSINILNLLGEFMEDYSHMQKAQQHSILLNQIPHAIEGLLFGYHLFQACFPE